MGANFCAHCKRDSNDYLCSHCGHNTSSREEFDPEDGGMMPQMPTKKMLTYEEVKKLLQPTIEKLKARKDIGTLRAGELNMAETSSVTTSEFQIKKH